MKHVKNFDEFLQDENPNVDPKKKPDTGAADTTATADSPDDKETVPTAEKPAETPAKGDAEKPNTTSPDDEKKEDPKTDSSETPATDAADDTNKEVEDDTEVSEGNAFTAAMVKAKKDGLKEFEFKGKTYKIHEEREVKRFGDFIAENFALYPSYNNMLGSEVLRNVPITHQVNMAVYGKENVVEPTPTVVAVEVKEGQQYCCTNCGCKCDESEIEQNPEKSCSECGESKWEIVK